MNHFSYSGGRLRAEDVDIARLADEVGTPFYVYSTATLERHYRIFAEAFPATSLIAYSVKANGNLGVLKTLARLGAGADVVSAGELAKALAAGIPANRIVFSGVGKTAAEMKRALEAGIHQFNVESEPELLDLDRIARDLGKRAPMALRINPDVDARTHAKITTGTAENKFGVPWNRAREIYRWRAIFPASKSSASTCISAARSPNSSRSKPRSAAPSTSSRSCAPTATPFPAPISAADWACPTGRARTRRRRRPPMAPW